MLASPLEQDTRVDITDLTHASVEGNGVFDVLMRAVNAHLQKEWSANRLKGTEYSTVYLGALESTMNASLQFLLARDKTNAELDILKQQLVNLKVEEINAGKQGVLLDKQATDLDAATALKVQQRLNAIDELLTASQQRTNLASENLGIISRTAISNQQLLNLQVEKDNAIKQGLQLTAQTAVTTQQKINLEDELLTSTKQRESIENEIDVRTRQIVVTEAQSAKDLLVKAAQITSMVADDVVKTKQAMLVQEQVLDAVAKTALTEQQTLNISLEANNIPKQGIVLDRQASQIEAQTSLTGRQELQVISETLNVPKQGAVLDSQIAQLNQQTSLASAEMKLVEQKYVGRKQ